MLILWFFKRASEAEQITTALFLGGVAGGGV